MKYIFLFAALLLTCAGSGCYYDQESELYPTGVCDSTAVKYSTAIRTITETQCAYEGRHSASTMAGGINLSTYSGLKLIASDGRLLGSVEHQPGYSPMPKNTSKLPDCRITQIRIWVTAGAPDN